MAVLRMHIACCVLGLVMAVAGSACQADTSMQARKELDMAGLCRLPEDEAAVWEYVLERVGGKITAEAVTLLQAEFELVGDQITSSMVDTDIKTLRDDGIILNMERLEKYRYDHSTYHEAFKKEWKRATLERFNGSTKRAREYFSGPSHKDPKAPSPYQRSWMKNAKKLRVRAVALQKRCTAADGVGYDMVLEATLDTTGRATFSDFHVRYRYEDILTGKRPFSFERFNGDDKEVGDLLTAKTAGFTLAQLDEYMDKLGCVQAIPYPKEYSAAYYYRVHSWLNAVARLTGYPKSKEIKVKTTADETVEQVLVITGTSAASKDFGSWFREGDWLEDQ